MRMKTLLSVLVALALVISLLPAAVYAEPEKIFFVSPKVECSRARAAVAGPSLASGNHERYLDRVANAPAYVQEFYNWLVANSGADGVLADPTKATEYNGEYYHSVTTVSGSISFPYTNVQEANDTAVALVQEALTREFESFMAWTGVAYDAFDRDHPEVFWLSGRTVYSYMQSMGLSLKGKECTVTYTADMVTWLNYSGFDIRANGYCSAEAVAEGIRLRDDAIREIISGCPQGSVYEKIAYLNDTLTARNAYNSAVASGNVNSADFTAWKCISALVGNSGKSGPVCEGYARAFQVLCNQLKIPCVLVDGPAKSSLTDTPESHMWNYVQVDGRWYAVDVTWNDPYVFSAPNQKVSGCESRKWLLLGADTQVSGGLGFLASHQVVNQNRASGLSYTNGPALSSNAYEPNTTTGYTLSGKISSANTGDVTVQLWQDSTLLATITASGGSYAFEGVAPGDYRLTFSKTGHVTLTQTLTVAGDVANQNLKLCQLGDVTGDGRINMGDVARLYAHIKQITVITDPYTLLCMNVTGDTRINMGDVARLYAQIKG